MPLPGDTWPRTVGRIPAATLVPCARLEERLAYRIGLDAGSGCEG